MSTPAPHAAPRRSRKSRAESTAPAPLEQVRLLRPHTHHGHAYPAGHTLAVHPATAHWLCSAGVAAAAQVAAQPTAPAITPQPIPERE